MELLSFEGTRVTALPLSGASDLAALPLPSGGFFWLSCCRDELAAHSAAVLAWVQRAGGAAVLELHLSDLLNPQRPSGYDYTAAYDLLVFHGLQAAPAAPAQPETALALPPVPTQPTGFLLLERLLLSVHPSGCASRSGYTARLLASAGLAPAAAASAPLAGPDPRSVGARGIPGHPADLMLRIINHMVDGFLALRRDLSSHLDQWQGRLLNPHGRVADWALLLQALRRLHQLRDTCEDQRGAINSWLETVATWSEADTTLSPGERDALRVRGRDVLEHIDRVISHVRLLESNAESAVQIHFSAQSHRTNEIMRTLTVLTAIFLPLNLLAGIFGMNFDAIPLLHRSDGFWWALGLMAALAGGFAGVFWRKRYLSRSGSSSF